MLYPLPVAAACLPLLTCGSSFSRQAYYREGVALQALGREAEALAAFASGLSADPKSGQLLSGLVEATIKSPLKGTFHSFIALCVGNRPFFFFLFTEHV